MKRPAFKPKDIGVSVPDATGAVVLHLKDEKANEQMVPLTADLRASLGQHLISGPLAESQTHGPVLYVKPTRTRAYARQDGDLAIELQIGGGRAIHILLTGLHADALALQIQEVRSPAPGGEKASGALQ
jgi:hypothetical protein